MATSIIKRSGKKEQYQGYKIEEAIRKAFHSSGTAYNRSIYGDQVRTYSQWIDAVNSVSREEIMAVAKGIKLQAVYFMEGIQ